MTRKTLKIPNTQAATGMLYVGVIATFLGGADLATAGGGNSISDVAVCWRPFAGLWRKEHRKLTAFGTTELLVLPEAINWVYTES